jgi:nucleoside 2-deoxyribosyltransferase
MRIYLAGPFKSRKTVMPEARAALRAHGYIVDCRWIDADGVNEQLEANQDVADIANSDALVVYNPDGVVSEGKAFEMGLAWALVMPIVIVGQSACVFRHLPGIRVVDTIDDAVAALKREGVQPALQVT